jgi:hypothetical protein
MIKWVIHKTTTDFSFGQISLKVARLPDSKRHLSHSHRTFTTWSRSDIRTYKYVHGSTTLDTRRAAAYTDRVLYSTPASTPSATSSDSTKIVEAGEYTSHEILWSDHRPVSCNFEVNVRIADEEKRKAALAIVRSELDKLDEEWAPSIEVDKLELDFGEIRFVMKSGKTDH